jgi:hypothetical protein
MGLQAEEAVPKSFMEALCLPEQLAQNYAHTIYHLAAQEELKLQVVAKTIHLTNPPYHKKSGTISMASIKL